MAEGSTPRQREVIALAQVLGWNAIEGLAGDDSRDRLGRQATRVGAAPPTSITIALPEISPPVTGALRASIAPASCASPSRASIYEWVSKIPVTGEWSAAVQRTCGSIALA
jgi:hypothetical protein